MGFQYAIVRISFSRMNYMFKRRFALLISMTVFLILTEKIYAVAFNEAKDSLLNIASAIDVKNRAVSDSSKLLPKILTSDKDPEEIHPRIG